MENVESVCCLHRAGHLHTKPQRLRQRQRTVVADPDVERILLMVWHHDVGKAAVGGTDLRDGDDVRVPGQTAHRPLFPEESLPILLVELDEENLHRHRAI